MKITPRHRPSAEMNIVPYVDVMLVLLVIFMITAPLIHQGVHVDLPKTSAEALPQEKVPPLIVSIDKTGALFLNVSQAPTESILPEILSIRIAAELKRDPTRKVLVRGDEGVNYGNVVNAMAMLQKAGAGSIGLITDAEAVQE